MIGSIAELVQKLTRENIYKSFAYHSVYYCQDLKKK